MIYNSRKYPTSLFIQKSNDIFHKGYLIIYKKNNAIYVAKIAGYMLNGSLLINTNWEFAETIELISTNQITHISKNSIE